MKEKFTDLADKFTVGDLTEGGTLFEVSPSCVTRLVQQRPRNLKEPRRPLFLSLLLVGPDNHSGDSGATGMQAWMRGAMSFSGHLPVRPPTWRNPCVSLSAEPNFACGT